MKKFVLILLAIMIATPIFAQNAKLKALTQQMASATVKGDFKLVIEHTDPAIVAKAGGKDAMIKSVTTMFAKMKQSGMELKNATAGEPGKVVTSGKKQFCLVPETVAMQVPQSQMMPKGIYTLTSSLLAVSDDNGKNWYFVNSIKMDDAALYQLYPELKGKLSIPPPTQPKFTPVE